MVLQCFFVVPFIGFVLENSILVGRRYCIHLNSFPMVCLLSLYFIWSHNYYEITSNTREWFWLTISLMICIAFVCVQLKLQKALVVALIHIYHCPVCFVHCSASLWQMIADYIFALFSFQVQSSFAIQLFVSTLFHCKFLVGLKASHMIAHSLILARSRVFGNKYLFIITLSWPCVSIGLLLELSSCSNLFMLFVFFLV